MRFNYNTPLSVRLESRLDIAGPDDCWEWTAGKIPDGYGCLRYRGESWLAHRAMWALIFGHPGDLHVLHTCDNPPCCNWRHLFLGTNTDNVADRVAKGRERHPIGLNHWHARWTEDDVRAMRQAFASGESQAAIARRYGVRSGNINRILDGTTWRHVV